VEQHLLFRATLKNRPHRSHRIVHRVNLKFQVRITIN
jgi:hypothetical protein